jgi:hypothetical protein
MQYVDQHRQCVLNKENVKSHNDKKRLLHVRYDDALHDVDATQHSHYSLLCVSFHARISYS